MSNVNRRFYIEFESNILLVKRTNSGFFVKSLINTITVRSSRIQEFC